MRKLILALLLSMASLPAWAEPAEYDLKVTGAELNLIGNALGTRPFAEVQALVGKLQHQVTMQNKPQDPKPADPPK